MFNYNEIAKNVQVANLEATSLLNLSFLILIVRLQFLADKSMTTQRHKLH